jgi:hypothetical protein
MGKKNTKQADSLVGKRAYLNSVEITENFNATRLVGKEVFEVVGEKTYEDGPSVIRAVQVKDVTGETAWANWGHFTEVPASP